MVKRKGKAKSSSESSSESDPPPKTSKARAEKNKKGKGGLRKKETESESSDNDIEVVQVTKTSKNSVAKTPKPKAKGTSDEVVPALPQKEDGAKSSKEVDPPTVTKATAPVTAAPKVQSTAVPPPLPPKATPLPAPPPEVTSPPTPVTVTRAPPKVWKEHELSTNATVPAGDETFSAKDEQVADGTDVVFHFQLHNAFNLNPAPQKDAHPASPENKLDANPSNVTKAPTSVTFTQDLEHEMREMEKLLGVEPLPQQPWQNRNPFAMTDEDNREQEDPLPLTEAPWSMENPFLSGVPTGGKSITSVSQTPLPSEAKSNHLGIVNSGLQPPVPPPQLQGMIPPPDFTKYSVLQQKKPAQVPIKTISGLSFPLPKVTSPIPAYPKAPIYTSSPKPRKNSRRRKYIESSEDDIYDSGEDDDYMSRAAKRRKLDEDLVEDCEQKNSPLLLVLPSTTRPVNTSTDPVSHMMDIRDDLKYLRSCPDNTPQKEALMDKCLDAYEKWVRVLRGVPSQPLVQQPTITQPVPTPAPSPDFYQFRGVPSDALHYQLRTRYCPPTTVPSPFRDTLLQVLTAAAGNIFPFLLHSNVQSLPYMIQCIHDVRDELNEDEPKATLRTNGSLMWHLELDYLSNHTTRLEALLLGTRLIPNEWGPVRDQLALPANAKPTKTNVKQFMINKSSLEATLNQFGMLDLVSSSQFTPTVFDWDNLYDTKLPNVRNDEETAQRLFEIADVLRYARKESQAVKETMTAVKEDLRRVFANCEGTNYIDELLSRSPNKPLTPLNTLFVRCELSKFLDTFERIHDRRPLNEKKKIPLDDWDSPASHLLKQSHELLHYILSLEYNDEVRRSDESTLGKTESDRRKSLVLADILHSHLKCAHEFFFSCGPGLFMMQCKKKMDLAYSESTHTLHQDNHMDSILTNKFANAWEAPLIAQMLHKGNRARSHLEAFRGILIGTQLDKDLDDGHADYFKRVQFDIVCKLKQSRGDQLTTSTLQTPFPAPSFTKRNGFPEKGEWCFLNRDCLLKFVLVTLEWTSLWCFNSEVSIAENILMRTLLSQWLSTAIPGFEVLANLQRTISTHGMGASNANDLLLQLIHGTSYLYNLIAAGQISPQMDTFLTLQPVVFSKWTANEAEKHREKFNECFSGPNINNIREKFAFIFEEVAAMNSASYVLFMPKPYSMLSFMEYVKRNHKIGWVTNQTILESQTFGLPFDYQGWSQLPTFVKDNNNKNYPVLFNKNEAGNQHVGDGYEMEKLFKQGREDVKYNHWFHVLRTADSHKVNDVKNIGPNFPELSKVHIFEANAQTDEARKALQAKVVKKANDGFQKEKSSNDEAKQSAKPAQKVKEDQNDPTSEHRSGKKRGRQGKADADEVQGNP